MPIINSRCFNTPPSTTTIMEAQISTSAKGDVSGKDCSRLYRNFFNSPPFAADLAMDVDGATITVEEGGVAQQGVSVLYWLPEHLTH